MLVNRCPELLEEEIYSASSLRPRAGIDWCSPLRSDDYAEYYDEDFLDKLGVCLNRESLESFWPQSGPRWDGLGVTDGGQYLMVEAKAHVRELRSHISAKSDSSISRILYSFSKTKEYLRVDARTDWTRPFYQYANRLAHLYMLHVLNKVDAYLVNVYFLKDGDMKKHGTIVPQTIEEWESAILAEKIALGLPPRHRLSSRVIDTFIDVGEIERRATAC